MNNSSSFLQIATSENVALMLYSYIQNTSRLPKGTKEEMQKYKSKIYYYVRKLEEKGQIKKIGEGIYQANSGATFVQLTKGVGKSIRSHAYRFLLRVPFITNYELIFKKQSLLNKLKAKQVPQGISFRVNRHLIVMSKESIQVIFYSGKSFFVDSAKTGDELAILELKKTIQILEKKIGINLKWGQHWQFNCFSKHHARINDSLAKYYNNRGINQIYIKDNSGKVWLLIDNSFNLFEFEGVDSIKATQDIDEVITPFMNKIREDPFLLDKLVRENEELKKNMITMIEVQRDQTYIINQLINKNK